MRLLRSKASIAKRLEILEQANKPIPFIHPIFINYGESKSDAFDRYRMKKEVTLSGAEWEQLKREFLVDNGSDFQFLTFRADEPIGNIRTTNANPDRYKK
jgi:hypothetical protein